MVYCFSLHQLDIYSRSTLYYQVEGKEAALYTPDWKWGLKMNFTQKHNPVKDLQKRRVKLLPRTDLFDTIEHDLNNWKLDACYDTGFVLRGMIDRRLRIVRVFRRDENVYFLEDALYKTVLQYKTVEASTVTSPLVFSHNRTKIVLKQAWLSEEAAGEVLDTFVLMARQSARLYPNLRDKMAAINIHFD